MTERMVLVKLKAEFAEENTRHEIAKHSQEVLAAVPGVIGVTVAVPGDVKSAASWDLCFTVRFATIDDVPAYSRHPDHRAYVNEYLRPRTECIKAWNFRVL